MERCILVTGATGWIGHSVCRRLKEQGCHVIGVGRSIDNGAWNQRWRGDIIAFANPDAALEGLLKKASVIIHCAGHAHRSVETNKERTEFKHVNVEGTRAVIAACLKNNIKRLIYISTIAGYDWTTAPPGGVAEEGKLNPTSSYAATKLEGELLVRNSGLDWRVVRLATVFGVGDHANFARLARSLKAGRFYIPGEGTASKSVIPISLAAELILQLALLETPEYRLLNAALSHAPTLREICDAFSRNCEFKYARSVPSWLLGGGACVGDLIKKAYPRFPLTTANVKKLTVPTVVSNYRLRIIYPALAMPTFPEALQSSIGFYRNI